MQVDIDIVDQWISKLDGKTGTCTVTHSDYTMATGNVTAIYNPGVITLLCTYTPSSNNIITGVTYNVDTNEGQVTLSISDINYPVIGNYQHVVIATVKYART